MTQVETTTSGADQPILDGEETDFPPQADASAQRRIREPQWDCLRFAATAAVVLIHVLAFAFNAVRFAPPVALQAHFDDLRALSQALRWAVPSFALLTGVLVWGRPWNGGFAKYVDFLRRRAMVVALPYLVWSCVYYVLRPSVMGVHLPPGRIAWFWDFLNKLVDGTVWFHLYFVPIVLVLYLLTPPAAKLARLSPEAFVLGVVALSLAWRVTFFAQAATYVPWGALLNNVIAYAPYAAMGAWIAVRKDLVRKVLMWTWPLLLAGGLYGLWQIGAKTLRFTDADRLADLAMHLPVRLRYESLGMLIGFAAVLGMLGLAWFVSGRWGRMDRAIESMYPASFGIYLVHPLVTSAVVSVSLRYLLPVQLLSWWWIGVAWVAVFAITWVIVWLMLRTKLTRWTM